MFRNQFAILAAAAALTAAPALAIERVVNGDFEAGATGFSTDYVLAPLHDDARGDLYITTNAGLICGCFAAIADHTSGFGKMGVYDGAANADSVMWGQTLSVAAHADYNLTFWLANLGTSGPTPSISARIDGSQILSTGGLAYSSTWTKFETMFNSGASTSLILSFVDTANTHSFNDFAFDDISVTGAAPTAGVPEPTVWALLLAGFGLAGTALRRRRGGFAH